MSSTESRVRRDLGALLGEPAFGRLDQELGEPNLFSILSSDALSSSVNAFLAWLLNPNGGHGLEDGFLRAFLAEVISHPPAARGTQPEGISPIPYQAVSGRALGWDLMDVRCADLRETNVSTDFHLGASDGRVDMCLWNDSYGFTVYVENRLAARDAWRQTGGESRPWQHRTEEYLLDLYHQWATPEAGGYDILQVFMSLDETEPDETRFVHPIGYAWMYDTLATLAARPTASEHVRLLVKDFRRWLRREIPVQLDPAGLHRDLDELAGAYGLVISRLIDHVSECTGCDDSDLALAFHDVYRRSKATVDALWRAVLQRADPAVEALCAEVEQLLTDEDGVILLLLPNRIQATSPRWVATPGAESQPCVEVYASAVAATSGILAYARHLGPRAEAFWQRATEVAEASGEELCARRHAKLNFHLAKTFHTGPDASLIAADFVRYCRFVNRLFPAR